MPMLQIEAFLKKCVLLSAAVATLAFARVVRYKTGTKWLCACLVCFAEVWKLLEKS